MQSRVSLQLIWTRLWASILVLWKSLIKGCTYLAQTQIFGVDVADLSPGIKKSKIKPEIPQNLPG